MGVAAGACLKAGLTSWLFPTLRRPVLCLTLAAALLFTPAFSSLRNPHSALRNPSPPLVVWLEAEYAVSTTFDDIYPALGLSGGRGLHFSTPNASEIEQYNALYHLIIPRTGRYALWSRRHLLYYDEGQIPLVNRLTRYIEMWWRIDGGPWQRPVVEATPVNVKGAYPSSVGHLGYTRTGDADMAGQFIGWYLDTSVDLTEGSHIFEVTFRLQQTAITPFFQPLAHRYYGLLDAFAFSEPGYVPNGRLPPDFAVAAAPDRPRPVATGRIHIDTSARQDTIPNLIGFSLVGTAPKQVERIQALRPALIRLCHLYNLADVTRDAQGNLRIDWTRADEAVDHIFNMGSEPLMCISYTPEILSTMPADVPRGPVNGDPGMYPPSDYAAWEEVVYRTVYHFNVERGLNIRYWEVWNEPNNIFWRVWHIWPWLESLPFSDYFNSVKKLVLYLKLYEHTARGAVRADPTIRIGGPSVLCDGDVEDITGSVRWWIGALAWWCDWRDLRLDFVSLHLYGGSPDSIGPPDYGDLIRRAGAWGTGSDGRVPEVIIDEWNALSMEGGHDTIHAYHAVWAMDTLYNMMEAGAGHSVYMGAGTGFLGMFRTDDFTPTPTYHIFRMFSLLERNRISVRAEPDDIRAIASRSENRITVLLWRFGVEEREVEIRIASVQFRNNAVYYSRWLMDDNHSNLKAGPDHAELESVEQATLSVNSGDSIRITAPLPPTSASLLVFEQNSERTSRSLLREMRARFK